MIEAKDLLNRIDVKIVEEHEKEPRRGYLGISQLGVECDRALWYNFHWASFEKFDAQKLRLFARGHKEEERFLEWLKPICEELMPVNPKTGKQWKVTAHNDIMAGHMDGVCKIDGVWYLLEFKTHGDKSFKELLKLKSVRAVKPVHFSQTQQYMHLGKLKQALYFAINKNTDEIYIEVIPYDADYSIIDYHRGLDCILDKDGTSSARISEASNWWQCNMCNYKAVCKGGKLPDRNCRTCRHSVACMKDIWVCEKFNQTLTKDEQITNAVVCDGYEPHEIFLPDSVVQINLVK